MPASAASIIASAAKRAGTNIIDVFACVAFTASATVLNTGTPRISVPPFPGVVPPTTLVPYSNIFFVWKLPSLPVIPCTINRVDSFISILIVFFFSFDHYLISAISLFFGGCHCHSGGFAHCFCNLKSSSDQHVSSLFFICACKAYNHRNICF